MNLEEGLVLVKQACAWLVVLLLFFVNGLESCSSKDEETAIRELVRKGQRW